MSRYAFCGLSREHLGELVTELAPRREARCESRRRQRRQAGARPEYELVFTGRLLVTLVRLRTGLTREALGVIYQVGSSAIGEIGPLLAGRGFAVPQGPGLRLRILVGVCACAGGRKRHTTHRRHRNPGPSAGSRTGRGRQARREPRKRPAPRPQRNRQFLF
jgi:hypothetical protein